MRKSLALILSFAAAFPARAQSAGDSLQWRNIGPTYPGRIVAVAGSVARPDEYYMGTTGGGVWKTTDGGKTAFPVTDAYFGGTIGAIAVAETNPDIVYVGGGETPIRGNVSHGDGMWKSTDGGKTWTNIGLNETQYIGRVRLHPTNPDIVYVAALGHVFGPNPERGVFKSTDGGRTWTKKLYVNDSTGAVDLVMDPKNPDVLYAGMWEANRRPWALKSGGPGSGIWKSTDAGETWNEITRNPGLPAGLIGNIGLAVSPINSNIVWAMVENEPGGGLYKSGDAGATWARTSDDRNIRQRAWYYSKVYASPIDTQQVVVLNVSPMWSSDGGKTFRSGFGGGDNHDMWWAPDGKRMAISHDHGTTFTADSGRTRVTPPMANAQLYHVHMTTHAIPHVCGAQQDASSQCAPIRGPIPVPGQGGRGGGGAGGGRGGAPAAAPATPTGGFQEFYNTAGGESGYISTSPINPDISYGGNYGGDLSMRDRISGRSMSLDPWPLNPMGHDARDAKYRFQWTFPIVHSPHNPRTIYVGSNVVWRSTDEGKNFTVFSPDLTRHDPRTLGPSGGPISKDQTSVEYYATVFTLAESPITPGVIWTGSDDGRVFITRNNGTTWTDVTPKGIPEWMRMSIIDASPHAPGTAWLAGNRYQLDDFTPYLFRTTDYGRTWVRITDGIPRNEFTRAIREDLARPGMLYAATERSMYVSYDHGRTWQSLKRNLPPVPVHDIALKGDDMAIATHGRSFWVLEGLDALRNAPDRDTARAANRDFLYQPPLTPRGSGILPIRYELSAASAGQPVSFELVDRNGRVFKKVTSTDSIPDPVAVATGGGRGGRGGGGAAPAGPARVPNAAGMNRYNLNLSHPGAPGFNGMILWGASLGGPTIAPGQYSLRMRVGTAPWITKQVRIIRDPRADATDADVAAQVELSQRIVARVTEANNGVRTIRSIRRQLQEKMPAMESNTSFRTLSKNLLDSLIAVEDSLYQTKNRAGQDPLNFPIRLNNQLAALNGFVMSGERRPTKQSYEVYDILAPKLAAELRRLRYIQTVMLPRVNASLKAAGQAEIVPTTDEPPAPPGGGRGGGPGQ
ncbi:MAG TPA: glycosyl hydrolase [Gemmatimonadaceae bacterium]|nr:glycosyl hydrolase [Gemmatimonadaceae bacterium]